MEYVTGYMAGFMATMIIAAIRTPNNELRGVTIVCLMWPITMFLIIAAIILDMFNIAFDINRGTKMFGIRKSPEKNISGVGITVFGYEFQIYKVLA